MKYTIEKLENNQVKFTFKLNAEEWEASVSEAYLKNKHKYSYPGYRKGKVPRKLLEGIYGKGLFYDDALNECFPKYYGEALDKEKEVFPVDRPEVDVTKIDEKGVEYTAVVTVKPEVTLGEYKGIKIEKKEYNVTEEDINNELATYQEKIARMTDIEGRACENGDTVTIDYSGSLDGKKFEGGIAENQELVLGSNMFIPGFEEQVLGMNVGEERDINVKFPEEYHAEDLKGKDTVFHINLKKIQKKELPELNDELAKDVSEFDTLEELKNDIKTKKAEQNAKRAETEWEDELVKTIVDNATVEIPACMIETQIDEIIQDMQYRMMYQGLKLEDYLKYIGQTMEEFRKSNEETAKIQTKTQLVIDKIIKTENIKSDAKSLNEKIKELAKQANKTAKEYKENMPERQLAYLENQIISDKLFAFLKENNA